MLLIIYYIEVSQKESAVIFPILEMTKLMFTGVGVTCSVTQIGTLGSVTPSLTVILCIQK